MRSVVLTRGPQVRHAILGALVVFVPTLFLRMLNDPFDVPKISLLAAGVALAGAVKGAEVLQGRREWAAGRLTIVAAALAAPLALGWLFSPYKEWALMGQYGRWQGLLPYLLVVAFGLLLADAFARDAIALAWRFVLSGAFVGGYAVVQVIGADPFSWTVFGEETRAATSTLGNSNFTGGYLATVMPVAVGLWFVDPERRRWALRLGLLVLSGWLVARSEGGWAAGVAGLAIVGGYLAARSWSWARLAGAVVAAAIAVVVVGAVAFSIAKPSDPRIPVTVGARADWWQAAVGMGVSSPFVGRGPNVYAVEAAQHRTVHDALTRNFSVEDDPHSVPLSLLAAAGIPGVLGFGLALIVIARRIFEPEDVLAVAFVSSAAAYFVQSLVSIDELSLRVALWVALAGSFSVVASPKPAVTTRKGRRSREDDAGLRAPVAIAAIAVVAAFVCVLGARFVVADARVHHAMVLFGQGDALQATREFDRALGFREDLYYRRLLARESGEIALARGAPGVDLLERSRAAFEYLDYFPHVNALVDLARILRDWGEVDPTTRTAAVAMFGRAHRLDPLNPLLKEEFVASLLDLEDYEQAASVARADIELLGEGYPRLWSVLAVAEARRGRLEEAEAALQRAVELGADDPRVEEARQLIESAR